ncbi:MAG: SH3 domain-containing protein, partial [Aggregatilineales bacterium]
GSTLYPELFTRCYQSLPVQITEYGRQSFSQVYPIDPAGMFIVVRGNGAYQLQVAADDTLRDDRGILLIDTSTEGRFPDGGEGIATYQLDTMSNELQMEITGQSDEIMLHNPSGKFIAPETRFYDASRGVTIQTYSELSDEHYTVSILADFYYEFRVLETIEAPSIPGPDLCTVRPYGAVNQRSGPGLTFTVVNVLSTGEVIPVSGQSVDDEGYIWWQLEADETWLRSDVIELAGDCSTIPTIPS